MYGIPTSGTPEAITFWNSFWSALYSGLITGIVVGLIVGFILWKVQLKIEKRKTEREYENEVYFLKRELNSAINQPDSINIDFAENSLNQNCVAVYNLLCRKPIRVWNSCLPTQSALFDTLENFIYQYERIQITAKELDLELRNTIRKHNYTKDIGVHVDPVFITFYIGRMLHFTNAEILPLLIYKRKIEELEDTNTILCSNEPIASLSTKYLTMRSALKERFDCIKNLMD